MSLAVLEEMIGEFVERTYGCFGSLARPNHTFFSLEMVARSLEHLRREIEKGRRLTPRGDRFAACAVAHLAYLALQSFQRRGLESSASVHWSDNPAERRMGVFASRPQDAGEVVYGQEFLRDLPLLLDPPDPFPAEGSGAIHRRSDLEVPLEYVYQIGVHLMMSPRSVGSWPRPPGEEEMKWGLRLLVDDLVVDLHLPADDREMERFCGAAVWPPAGWPGNELQQVNLTQVVRRAREDPGAGDAFLRALLRAQLTPLRHLACRTLLLLGRAPADPEETGIFESALDAPGAATAFHEMADHCWREEGQEGSVPLAFVEDCEREWRLVVEGGPRPEWLRSPVLEDPLYSVGRGNPGAADTHPEIAHQLLRRYPDEWWSIAILGKALLATGETVAGARILRQAADESPGDLTAHRALVGYLLKRRKVSEAESLSRAAVELQPWNDEAVELALATAVRGLTR